MSLTQNGVPDALRAHKLVAILRGLPPERVAPVALALWEGGVRLVELTFDQSGRQSAADTCAAIAEINAGGRLLCGAGTVMTSAQADAAARAGARFLISPHTDPGLIRHGKSLGLCVVPGAFTPSEAAAAWAAGADAVKLFPAGQLGPGYVRALRAPLSHIPLVAVGGVDEGNAKSFLDAGCVAVGVGGGLADLKTILAGDYAALREAARRLVAAIQG